MSASTVPVALDFQGRSMDPEGRERAGLDGSEAIRANPDPGRASGAGTVDALGSKS